MLAYIPYMDPMGKTTTLQSPEVTRNDHEVSMASMSATFLSLQPRLSQAVAAIHWPKVDFVILGNGGEWDVHIYMDWIWLDHSPISIYFLCTFAPERNGSWKANIDFLFGLLLCQNLHRHTCLAQTTKGIGSPLQMMTSNQPTSAPSKQTDLQLRRCNIWNELATGWADSRHQFWVCTSKMNAVAMSNPLRAVKNLSDFTREHRTDLPPRREQKFQF